MRTSRQGTLDGLCGVYVIINALELVGVAEERGSGLRRDLFLQMVYGLGAVNLLTAMREGLNAIELMDAARLAFAWLEATHGIQLEITHAFKLRRRPRSMRPFIRALKALVAEPEAAVILSYERPNFGHWTVVKEVTPKELLLRDSSSVSVLRISDFVVDDGPCRFVVTDTLVVRRMR